MEETATISLERYNFLMNRSNELEIIHSKLKESVREVFWHGDEQCVTFNDMEWIKELAKEIYLGR